MNERVKESRTIFLIHFGLQSISQSLSLIAFEISGNPVVLETENIEAFPGPSHFYVYHIHAEHFQEAPFLTLDPMLSVSHSAKYENTPCVT